MKRKKGRMLEFSAGILCGGSLIAIGAVMYFYWVFKDIYK